MKGLSNNLQQADINRLVQTLSPRESERRFYVYALCKDQNKPFYIGKGDGARVLSHFKEAENAQAYINQDTTLSDDEKQKRLQDLKAKLGTILTEGEKCVPVIIKWGLTEDEAFMCESALINLCLFSNTELTNIANGHASELEVPFGTRTRTIEAFLKECAFDQKSVEELNQYSIALININELYPKCQSNNGCVDLEKVRQAVSGFWNFNNSSTIPMEIGYILAIYQMRVVGIFHVQKAFIVKNSRNNEEAKNAMPTFPEEVRKFDRLMCAVRSMKEAREKLTREDYDMLAAHFKKTGEVPDKALEKFGKRAFFSLDEHGKNMPDEVLSFMGCQPTMNDSPDNLARRFQRNPVIHFRAKPSNGGVTIAVAEAKSRKANEERGITPSLIHRALKGLTLPGGFTLHHSGNYYQNNITTKQMDSLLPHLGNGEGVWKTGDIYRFWIRPTKLCDGVRLTFELGPNDKLPEPSRKRMKEIGGILFNNWRPNKKSCKFQYDIHTENCEPTEDAIRKAVANLLKKLEEWQGQPVCN